MSTPSSFSIEITQPPLNTSQIGVMSAASEHFGLGWSEPELFVGSGHGFVTNVTYDLCPSGPYVWKTSGMLESLANLRLDVEMIGFLMTNSASDEERSAFHESIKQAMVAGKICTIECLDHQVVRGWDEDEFKLAQPWNANVESTPACLKFDSWEGFSEGPPVVAFAVSTNDQSLDSRAILKPALEYALDLWDRPEAHSEADRYGMGASAYTNWRKAITNGFGEQHGAWWNGVVWGECKLMTARYFESLNGQFRGVRDLTKSIATSYRAAGDAMMTASNLKLDKAAQTKAVDDAEIAETAGVDKLRELLTSL